MTLIDELQIISKSLSGIYPELFLIVFFLFSLVFELVLRKKQSETTAERVTPYLHWVGAFSLLAILLFQWFDESRGALFHQMLVVDDKAVFFKLLISGAWLVTLFHIRTIGYRFPIELYALLAGAVLGALLLSMASNLLTIYLSIELISLCSYLLVGMSPHARASEGGLKYLLFGGISSAIMLYGISFIYGLTGTLDLTETLRPVLSGAPDLALTVTMLLTLGGLLFKLSLIPFHIWTPDTYQATPTPIVSFLSAVPKIAVLMALFRLVSVLPETVLPLLGGIALISMTAGNVGALWQQNARRLMAYSTIAQAGYLIVGIVAFGETGFHTSVFYLVSYVLLSMSAFLLIDFFSPQTDAQLSLFNGKGNAWIAGGIAMTLVMVALAGLPPTVGFTGKWLVFSALWEKFTLTGANWMFVLLAGGILNAAISLAYYLKIPYLLFFKNREDSLNADLQTAGIASTLSAIIIALVVVLLFLQPGHLISLISKL